MSQILEADNGMPRTMVYGHARLGTVHAGTLAWEYADRVGSVRLNLEDDGYANAAIAYDPWGAVAAGSPRTFGFTGELQNTSTGLQYLRARWYNPTTGTLLGRDPFDGYPNQPYSLHPYQYAYSQPTRFTDPSGRNPCQVGDAMSLACKAMSVIHQQLDECGITDDLKQSARLATMGNLTGSSMSQDCFDAYIQYSLMVVDFLPVIGDGKGFTEALTGYDLITNEPLGWERWLGFLCLSELRGGAKVLKGFRKGSRLTNIGRVPLSTIDELVARGGIDASNASAFDSKLPYTPDQPIYGQRNLDECVVASCRMIINDPDSLYASDSYISAALFATGDGIYLSNASKVLNDDYGLSTTYKKSMTIDDLKTFVRNDKPAIVGVNTTCIYVILSP